MRAAHLHGGLQRVHRQHEPVLAGSMLDNIAERRRR